MVAQIDWSYAAARPWKLWSRLLSYSLFEGRPLTTRGQWINPLVFGLFALEKRLPQFKAIEKPVFILGTGRSGTTILGIVLSMHQDVGFLNEPKALWHSVHGQEDLIGSYSLGPARYRLYATDATPTLIRVAHRLYGAYLRMTFSQRVVDKYPEMIFRIPFLKAIFPDARFLFLARNGWDTCASIDAWSERLAKREGEAVHDWWGANRRKWNLLLDQIIPEHPDLCSYIAAMRDLQDHRVMAAVEWVVTMREGIRICAEFPDDVLHVSYEHLCQQPAQMARQIADFVGLRNDDSFVSYACAVFAPVKQRPAFDMPDFLKGPFHQTMNDLGYTPVGTNALVDNMSKGAR